MCVSIDLLLCFYSDCEVFPKNHAAPFSKVLTFFRKEPFTLDAYYNNPKELPYPNSSIGTASFTSLTDNKCGISALWFVSINKKSSRFNWKSFLKSCVSIDLACVNPECTSSRLCSELIFDMSSCFMFVPTYNLSFSGLHYWCQTLSVGHL